jgi:hypothetical protein
MTTPEGIKPKRKLKKWQITLLVILVLYVVGSFSSSNSNNSTGYTSTATATKTDSATHLACEHWRNDLANASIQTPEEQRANAKKVNQYASVSKNPMIVQFGRQMLEAMTSGDAQAYLAAGTGFGIECQQVGE